MIPSAPAELFKVYLSLFPVLLLNLGTEKRKSDNSLLPQIVSFMFNFQSYLLGVPAWVEDESVT